MAKRPARLNIEIPDERLLTAVRHLAVDLHMPVRQVVTNALREYVLRQVEQLEDLEDVAWLKAHPIGDEASIPWEQVKAELEAKARDEAAVDGVAS